MSQVSGMSNFLWDRSLMEFFHKAKPLTPPTNALGSKALYNSKSFIQNSGQTLNNATYSVVNALGKRMIASADKAGAAIAAGGKAGFFGQMIHKSKLLTNLGNGLKAMGTTAGPKMPGLGTIFGIGTAAVGLFKAGKKLLTGDLKGAAHEVIKTAGSTAGIMLSMAVFVPGVNIFAALALAMGVGFAGDFIGKKVADTLLPSVAKREKVQQALNTLHKHGNPDAQKWLGTYG